MDLVWQYGGFEKGQTGRARRYLTYMCGRITFSVCVSPLCVCARFALKVYFLVHKPKVVSPPTSCHL